MYFLHDFNRCFCAATHIFMHFLHDFHGRFCAFSLLCTIDKRFLLSYDRMLVTLVIGTLVTSNVMLKRASSAHRCILYICRSFRLLVNIRIGMGFSK